MKKAVSIVLAAGLMLCASAQAQRMYRCGNQYQEYPCAGSQQSKAVNTTGAGKSAAASTASVPECAARGTASQKIVWARESGATQDKQIADLRAKGQIDQKQADLIAAVYSKRGTAPEVRAAIEADCAAEKDQAVQAAALRAAAAKIDGKGMATAPATTAPASAGSGGVAITQPGAAGSTSAAASSNKALCDTYSRQLDSLPARRALITPWGWKPRERQARGAALFPKQGLRF